jgi:hypothetical protein
MDLLFIIKRRSIDLLSALEIGEKMEDIHSDDT